MSAERLIKMAEKNAVAVLEPDQTERDCWRGGAEWVRLHDYKVRWGVGSTCQVYVILDSKQGARDLAEKMAGAVGAKARAEIYDSIY